MRGGRANPDGLYRITFQDHSRQKTLEVVETLLNTFVEQTLGTKRTGQESAQRFLDDEIAKLELRLTESESRLAEFKKKNVGSMPGEGGDYFARLQAEMSGESQVRQQLGVGRDASRRVAAPAHRRRSVPVQFRQRPGDRQQRDQPATSPRASRSWRNGCRRCCCATRRSIPR